MSDKMKEIKAIVEPFMLEHVLDALATIEGLPGVTVSHVLGWGKRRGEGVAAAGRDATHAFAPRTKLDIVVPAELAQQVIDAILRSARTGKPGDGKVFVLDLTDAVKISTGEHGDAAI